MLLSHCNNQSFAQKIKDYRARLCDFYDDDIAIPRGLDILKVLDSSLTVLPFNEDEPYVYQFHPLMTPRIPKTFWSLDYPFFSFV